MSSAFPTGAPQRASNGSTPGNGNGQPASAQLEKSAEDARLENLIKRINSLAGAKAAVGGSSTGTGILRDVKTGQVEPVARPRVVPRRSPATVLEAAEQRPEEPEKATVASEESDEDHSLGRWVPKEPQSIEEMGLSETEIDALVLKFLMARGDASGRAIAAQVKLPFILIDQLMRRMKDERLVVYRDAAQMNDYVYQLTDLGREQARRFLQDCTYFGACPVRLDEYVESVEAQTLRHLNPTEDDLRRAFADLLINQAMFRRLGPAINSGKGMFLFGYPGNGKTSIAERVTRCFGEHIWIPRAISIDGEIIRVFDPNHHHMVNQTSQGTGLLCTSGVDQRWVRVRRPTVIVGGELTMDQLEIQVNRNTGINEAPVQLKSNCGTLVIDDFGRQKMSVDELLNRWIVPLEKRYDFLCLPSGKTIQVPFDQLVIFSTNLEPKDLVDDAFLRRIPYKIEVPDPTEEEFRTLFKIMAPKLGFEYVDEPIDYLIERHYKSVNRPFRCCQPRDLLLQVRNYCLYTKEPMTLTPTKMDFAVENYFSVL